MSQVDLTNCDREPIHIPGSIQPHGVLVACAPDLTVDQVSANVEAFFGTTASALAGEKLDAILTRDSVDAIAAALTKRSLREANPVIVDAANGGAFEAIIHRPPRVRDGVHDGVDVVVVELVRRSDDARGFHPLLRNSVARFQLAGHVTELASTAADEIRKLTGFDRVMIYRFDADWNGEVIAEAKREDLEPFLGLHYPASDIPAQARRLYTMNWLRHIVEVGYAPSPLVPQNNPRTGAPLDLSFAVLRSVSPIHIEYLRNMGVSASMSISLLRDGELWGLVACHHYGGPRDVSFTVRETCEYLAHTLSWHLTTLERSVELARAMHAERLSSQIVREVTVAEDFVEGLASRTLVDLTAAGGAAVVYEGRVVTVGNTPSEEEVKALVAWLGPHAARGSFETDQLAATYPPAAGWGEHSAGLLAVPISRELGDYVLWFRPAVERVVDWAGDPNKTASLADGAPRLTPRGSFALWRETVRGRSLRWEPWEIASASSLRKAILDGVRRHAAALSTLNQRLVAADRAKDVFIATVSHELRTPLNAIVGWTKLLRGGKVAAEKHARAIEIIDRNAGAQLQLIEDLLDISRIVAGKFTLRVAPVDFVEVIDDALESVALAAEAKAIRIQRVLDDRASPVLGDAQRLRQMVANLVTNAVKFTPKDGRVRVTLEQDRSDLVLTVSDNGEGIPPEFLPHLFESFSQADESPTQRRRGLGLGLAIVRHIVEMHGGKVTAASEGPGKGSTFLVRLPISPMRAEDAAPPSAPRGPTSTQLAGIRALVVEDEDDARELVAQVIADAGATVTPCPDARSALEALAAGPHDVIVSDIGLPDQDGFELIRLVRADGRRLPAVALTAYTRAQDRTRALLAGFQAHVSKPVDAAELIAVIASLVDRISPAPGSGS